MSSELMSVPSTSKMQARTGGSEAMDLQLIARDLGFLSWLQSCKMICSKAGQLKDPELRT